MVTKTDIQINGTKFKIQTWSIYNFSYVIFDKNDKKYAEEKKTSLANGAVKTGQPQAEK